jgi:phage gp36-like protein
MAQRYAEIEDARRLGLGNQAFADEDVEALNQNLLSASEEADSYLANQYKLPLSAWGQDLRAAVSKIAVYEFLSVRGLSPEPGSADANIRKRAEDARAWLRDVSSGKATPSGIVDSTPNTTGVPGYQPSIQTSSQRGWSSRGEPRAGGPFVGD